MANRPDPVAPADPEARALAGELLGSRHAALSYTDAEAGMPGISRIAFGRTVDGTPVTLISGLAPHFRGLAAASDCAFMVGEPGPKGDPLSHPRLMVRARAEFIRHDDARKPALREGWLADHPKSLVYVDFPDFAFVLLHPVSGLLNAGFARAYRLSPEDLGQ